MEKTPNWCFFWKLGSFCTSRQFNQNLKMRSLERNCSQQKPSISKKVGYLKISPRTVSRKNRLGVGSHPLGAFRPTASGSRGPLWGTGACCNISTPPHSVTQQGPIFFCHPGSIRSQIIFYRISQNLLLVFFNKKRSLGRSFFPFCLTCRDTRDRKIQAPPGGQKKTPNNRAPAWLCGVSSPTRPCTQTHHTHGIVNPSIC